MFVLVAVMCAVMAIAVRFGPVTQVLSLEDVGESSAGSSSGARGPSARAKQ
jgi:hypothetical protein